MKVTDGFFLVGLSNVDSDRARNLQFLMERSWFDVPLVYANQRRAIIAIEKGAPGERAFNDAFAAWGSTSPSASAPSATNEVTQAFNKALAFSPPVAGVSPTAPGPATASNSTMPNNEPHRIKTLAVKGDAAENGGVPAGATAPVAKLSRGAPAPEPAQTRVAALLLSCQRCSHFTAELTLTSKRSAVSRRDRSSFLSRYGANTMGKRFSEQLSDLSVRVKKPTRILLLASIAFAAPAIAQAQVAGSTVLGVSVAELRDVTLGWSAKRTILGQSVYNDQNERVGSVDDIIVAPDKPVSYAIINAGGFLALAKHDVAIPVSQLKLVDNKLVLAGATKDALKASPPFEYPR